MLRTILLSVTCPVLPYLPHYLINSTISENKKVIEHKMLVVLSKQLLSETFHIPRLIQRDTFISICFLVKYSVTVLEF